MRVYLCGDTAHDLNTKNNQAKLTMALARRRAVGKEPKGGVGKYSTISVKNNICNISREIKDYTKNLFTHILIKSDLTRHAMQLCHNLVIFICVATI